MKASMYLELVRRYISTWTAVVAELMALRRPAASPEPSGSTVMVMPLEGGGEVPSGGGVVPSGPGAVPSGPGLVPSGFPGPPPSGPGPVSEPDPGPESLLPLLLALEEPQPV